MGVNIGSVKEIQIGVGDETNGIFMINVVIEIDLKNTQASFGNYKIEMDDRKRFEKLTQELGLRGQLDVLSLLSGQLYVALDMFPGQEGFQLHRESQLGLWEIPTLPSTKRQLMQSLVTSLENFTRFDVQGTSDQIKGLLAELRSDLTAMQLGRVGTNLAYTVVELRDLLTNPELSMAITNLNLALAQIEELGSNLNSQINPLLAEAKTDLKKAGATLDEAAETLRQLRAQLAPNSTLGRELVRTLDEATTTLNSLRQLIEQIERNPSSLITGKKESTP